MEFDFDERLSDVPLIACVWHTRSNHAGTFISPAVANWEMVITVHKETTTVTVRGPESHATEAHCPPDAEFMGIQFQPGAFMPHLTPKTLRDATLDLPLTGTDKFWLHGAAWQFPNYDNADVFVQRLLRDEILVHDSLVGDVLQGYVPDVSGRTVQRRVVQATGLTQSRIAQIERARYALTLLIRGHSIVDTVYMAGYADQPHLTRSLKTLVGQTPAQIVAAHHPPE